MTLWTAVLVASLLHATEVQRPKRIDCWIELKSETCKPGEAVVGVVWLSYSPVAGEMTTYQEHEAKVLFFFKTWLNLSVGATNIGTFDYGYVNPALCPTGPGQTITGNTIIDIQVSNYDFGCGANPRTDNPVWLYTFSWRPTEYKPELINISADLYNPPSVTLEVPDLGLLFPPKFAVEKWKLAFTPAYVQITDGTCYADCDTDTQLSIDDFICFQTQIAVGDPTADCDEDSILTIDDFICFQTLYAIGC